jgi:rhamnulose-1-phosphate aldolase
VLPYCLPASPAMMEANLVGLRTHNVVLWSKHGVMARSGFSVKRAAGPLIVRAFSVQTTLV